MTTTASGAPQVLGLAAVSFGEGVALLAHRLGLQAGMLRYHSSLLRLDFIMSDTFYEYTREKHIVSVAHDEIQGSNVTLGSDDVPEALSKAKQREVWVQGKLCFLCCSQFIVSYLKPLYTQADKTREYGLRTRP